MRKLLSLIGLFLSVVCYSQEITSGGGEVPIQTGQCISEEQHQLLLKEIKQNMLLVKQANDAKLDKNAGEKKLIWPVAKKAGHSYNSIYGISGFVDHDPNFDSTGVSILDYNCFKKTYNTATYNHSGTDIFLYPFKWELMEDESADVVAARDGIIIFKSDGNEDKNCSFCTNCFWNGISILHSDNTVATYGHLKLGSLTNIAKFGQVEQGEYLGKVGSSGISTGPHLHFEMMDANQKTIDPFKGNCNLTSTESLWEMQRPYKLPTINTLKPLASHQYLVYVQMMWKILLKKLNSSEAKN
jgi:murein DD-endopeptidase MepM/ murein hydrolase activator NlpD